MVAQRFGISPGNPISNDFPMPSRIKLAHVFTDLYNRNYVQYDEIILELSRLGRFTAKNFEGGEDESIFTEILTRLQKLSWADVMNFCERVFEKLLHGVGWEYEEGHISVDVVRDYYSKEINQILIEDNFGFSFENGVFERRGRPQTQKSIEKVGKVLSDPSLKKVKTLYNKALSFFSARPNPDAENCVKESLCALEACIEVLCQKDASKDFDKAINQLKGNDPRQITPPIAESMIKIHGYRGSGQGVAHAALHGNRVYPLDAELVLSLVADYITYLVGLFPHEEEIPF